MAELITPRSPINQPNAIANGIPASASSCLNHLKQIVIRVVPLPLSGPDVPPSKWHATPVKGTQTREQGLERALPRVPPRDKMSCLSCCFVTTCVVPRRGWFKKRCRGTWHHACFFIPILRALLTWFATPA